MMNTLKIIILMATSIMMMTKMISMMTRVATSIMMMTKMISMMTRVVTSNPLLDNSSCQTG